jgi:hypothetical protein
VNLPARPTADGPPRIRSSAAPPAPESAVARSPASGVVAARVVTGSGVRAGPSEVGGFETNQASGARPCQRVPPAGLPGAHRLRQASLRRRNHPGRLRVGRRHDLEHRQEQDHRSVWEAIAEAHDLVLGALRGGNPGRFALQAAIATLHASDRTCPAAPAGRTVVPHDARIAPAVTWGCVARARHLKVGRRAFVVHCPDASDGASPRRTSGQDDPA